MTKAAQHVAQGVTEQVWSTQSTRMVASLIGAEKVARKAILQTVVAMLAVNGKNGEITIGDYTAWKRTFQVNVAQCVITNVAEFKPELFGTKLVDQMRNGQPNQVNILLRVLPSLLYFFKYMNDLKLRSTHMIGRQNIA